MIDNRNRTTVGGPNLVNIGLCRTIQTEALKNLGFFLHLDQLMLGCGMIVCILGFFPFIHVPNVMKRVQG